MIKIVTNKKVENFILRDKYWDSTGPSDDGMRRGYSFTVHRAYIFSFENERHEDAGWTYDLHVVKETDRYGRHDMTATQEEFEEKFNFIAKALRNEGIIMLNIPAYMSVECKFLPFMEGEDVIKLTFNGVLYPLSTGIEALTAPELITRVSEEGADKKWRMIARAIGDYALLTSEHKVSLSSIPDELYGKEELSITLRKVTVDSLLKEGIIEDTDIEQALADFVRRIEVYRCSYHPLNTEGIEEYIINLPDELRRKVLRRCNQTLANLNLFLKYCPEEIKWKAFKERDFSWLPSHHPNLVASDLLHSILKYAKENPGQIGLEDVSFLFELEYEGLNREDYDICLAMADGCESTDIIAFVLKVGLLASVGEEELVEMLLDKEVSMHIELYSWSLKKIYEELNFAPGLAWIKIEEDRCEAERQRIAKERTDSNEKVVRFVQDSGKLAVRVSAECHFVPTKYKIYRDSEFIGVLLSDEHRVMLIEGRRYSYLVNIERVKKLHNGVFHFDVLEEDAGRIIGPKGSRIKEITQRLNQLGCEVRNIRIHTHMADEI